MPRRNKFGAKRVGNFASKLEAAVYEILLDKQAMGDISDLKCQAEVRLTDANIIYKPDFSFVERGRMAYAEAKGMETASWRIKRRLWTEYGPGLLYIYKGNHKYPFLNEVIDPRKK